MVEDGVVVPVINLSLPLVLLQQEGVVNTMVIPECHTIYQVLSHTRPDGLTFRPRNFLSVISAGIRS
jgi:hypothetical protein